MSLQEMAKKYMHDYPVEFAVAMRRSDPARFEIIGLMDQTAMTVFHVAVRDKKTSRVYDACGAYKSADDAIEEQVLGFIHGYDAIVMSEDMLIKDCADNDEWADKFPALKQPIGIHGYTPDNFNHALLKKCAPEIQGHIQKVLSTKPSSRNHAVENIASQDAWQKMRCGSTYVLMEFENICQHEAIAKERIELKSLIADFVAKDLHLSAGREMDEYGRTPMMRAMLTNNPDKLALAIANLELEDITLRDDDDFGFEYYTANLIDPACINVMLSNAALQDALVYDREVSVPFATAMLGTMLSSDPSALQNYINAINELEYAFDDMAQPHKSVVVSSYLNGTDFHTLCKVIDNEYDEVIDRIGDTSLEALTMVDRFIENLRQLHRKMTKSSKEQMRLDMNAWTHMLGDTKLPFYVKEKLGPLYHPDIAYEKTVFDQQSATWMNAFDFLAKRSDLENFLKLEDAGLDINHPQVGGASGIISRIKSVEDDYVANHLRRLISKETNAVLLQTLDDVTGSVSAKPKSSSFSPL